GGVGEATGDAADYQAGMSKEVLAKPFKEAKGMLVESFEREYLKHLLVRHHGNISRAALEAGIDRNYIPRFVKTDGIPVDRGKNPPARRRRGWPRLRRRGVVAAA